MVNKMKIVNLVKSELIKNYSIKKLIIISVIMLVVSIGFVEIYSKMYEKSVWSFSNFQKKIEELSNKENRTLEEDYNLMVYEVKGKIYTYLNSLEIQGNDYARDLAEEMIRLSSTNIGIKILKENYDSSTIQQICNTSSYIFESPFQGEIHHLCTAYPKPELDTLYLENEEKINGKYTSFIFEEDDSCRYRYGRLGAEWKYRRSRNRNAHREKEETRRER